MTLEHRTARRALLASALSLPMLSAPAQAQDLIGFLDEFSSVLSDVVATRTVVAICNDRDPAGADTRTATLRSWETRNEVRLFDALEAGVAALDAGLAAELAGVAADARAQIEPQLDDDSDCDMDELVAEEPDETRDAIRGLTLSAHIADIDPLPGPIPDTVNVLPVTALGLRATEVAALVTPENALDSDLEDAREAFLEYYFDSFGYVAAYGRVLEGGELREWRGPYQSSFGVECRDYADASHEQSFTAALGQDRIVVGTPRWSLLTGSGGIIALNDCYVLEPEAPVDIPEPDATTAGLELRPLDIAEAYAGPDAGPALGDIDRVLYVSRFDNRIDGFGNGYVDRREDIYVLLSDGAAFLHDWGFPPTDVDTDALAAREPDKWFTWRDDGGVAVLTAADGTTLRLDEAERLAAPGDGRALDAEFYYLQIGMGGGRSDRTYQFSGDGGVVFTRGGFFAGNFGSSYIIVSGNDDRVQTGRYRIDGYALIIETDAGEERRMIARLDSDTASTPGELIIEGQVYWLRDGDDAAPANTTK